MNWLVSLILLSILVAAFELFCLSIVVRIADSCFEDLDDLSEVLRESAW